MHSETSKVSALKFEALLLPLQLLSLDSIGPGMYVMSGPCGVHFLVATAT